MTYRRIENFGSYIACSVHMLTQLACYSSSMHPITNFLLMFVIVETTLFFAGGTLQPESHHGGGCDPIERAALLSFKMGITNDSTNLLGSWHGQDCCRWRGVKCSNQSGQVIKLHLRGPIPEVPIQLCYEANALHGEISPSLLSLKHLEHMDLSMNCLQGKYGLLPHFLGSLENLRYLNLSGIPFTGRVSSQLGNLSKLQYLDLGTITSNMYSTDITWLTKLPLLQYLSMTYVNLSGIADWPRTLNMIPSLRVISLSSCSLDSSSQFLQHFNLTELEKLDLSYNYLGGTVASAGWFWKANKLQELYLYCNSFTGTLPNFIGHFTSLRILDLTMNELVGPIPPGLWNLKYLTELYFSYNQLTGSLPAEIQALTSLVNLGLSNNNFNGNVPTQIGSLPNLIHLKLANNNFSGVITEEHFVGLKSLRYIDLSFNNLKVVLDSDWLPPFVLRYARFASCQMGPSFPAWLQHQEGITTLDMSGNSLKGEIPDWFWSTFSQATDLNISNNQISGSLPAHLDGMSVEYLYLGSNSLTGTIPSLPINIIILDISNNTFSGTLPSNLEASQLQILLINSNRFGGFLPESICKLQLTYLDLSNNIFEGEFPACFYGQNIQILLLSNNSLSGKFPTFLQNSTNLEFLDLSWNKFSGRLPAWIGDLGQLRFLLLRHNIFCDNIPVQITNLGYLQYLDLSSNNFSGSIPWHLANLTLKALRDRFMPVDSTYSPVKDFFSSFDLAGIFLVVTKGQLIYGNSVSYFTSIDLSDNFLTGEIPSDISSLDALINLNLSSNQLSGPIPRMIRALQSLASLDLSRNKLSGEIPSSLSSLSSLSYLNLSYNNLSGRIPSGRQLDTLNVDNPSLMYIGNNGLCGPPLQKNCSGNTTVIHGHLSGSGQEFESLTFYFGLMLGLVARHWVVFCALLFKKTWRISYFRFFDNMYDMIYVFVVVNWASFSRNTTADGAISLKDPMTELQQIE